MVKIRISEARNKGNKRAGDLILLAKAGVIDNNQGVPHSGINKGPILA